MRLWLVGPRLPLGIRAGIITSPVRPDIGQLFWNRLAQVALSGIMVAALLAIAASAWMLFELVFRVIPAQVMG